MNIPENLLYTKEHEWVKFEENKVIIGITDYAQNSLGDITFVELPEEGGQAKKGERIVTIESVKSVSDVYSPVDGEVEKVNEEVEETPETINESPFDKGWLCTIKADSPDKSGLMSPEEYKNYIESLE